MIRFFIDSWIRERTAPEFCFMVKMRETKADRTTKLSDLQICCFIDKEHAKLYDRCVCPCGLTNTLLNKEGYDNG